MPGGRPSRGPVEWCVALNQEGGWFGGLAPAKLSNQPPIGASWFLHSSSTFAFIRVHSWFKIQGIKVPRLHFVPIFIVNCSHA
jgi:hypothetical protein